MCACCTKVFKRAALLRGKCKPEQRKTQWKRKAWLWQKLRRAKADETISMLARAMKLSKDDVDQLEKAARRRFSTQMCRVAPLQSCSWLRDLTQEGIEPNPGPSCSALFLNSNGTAGAHRAVQWLQSRKLDVIAFCGNQG